jgi:hypothetical protein
VANCHNCRDAREAQNGHWSCEEACARAADACTAALHICSLP